MAKNKDKKALRIVQRTRPDAIELNLRGMLQGALGARLWREIGKLTSLQGLDLRINQIASLPQEIGKFTSLQRLYLDGNQLASLPDEIGKLTSLERLDLRGNQIAYLPKEISKLTSLERLDLRDNQIASLPKEIGKLTSLERLDLRGNQIAYLPNEIGKLTSLEWLGLQNNQLASLPPEIGELTSLQRLELAGNSLDIPDEILSDSENPEKILEYYFRTKEASRPLNEAKLIFVGFGEVGKTSLVNRLVHDTFDSSEGKTHGIEITKWIMTLGEDQVRLNVWDFGGQEIMHATHQFFLTERSLYLVVLNGRQGREDADAEYWLRLIESFGGDSPVIVVLNKSKAHPCRLNQRGLRKKFPNVREFIETDCEPKTGIDELCRAVERETDRLEHLRARFPGSWFEIKDRLSYLEENFLEYEAFRGVCAEFWRGGRKEPGLPRFLSPHPGNRVELQG